MFSAIFFVAIGMLIEPRMLIEYAVPIAVITVAVIFGKILTCSFGAFLAGNDGRTSLRVGMGLAQIGEFSFIIASLGLTLNVTSEFLYPIAVAVAAITTFLTPYLIRSTDTAADTLSRLLPRAVTQMLMLYTDWARRIGPSGDYATLAKVVHRSTWIIVINLLLVVAVFSFFAYLANSDSPLVPQFIAEYPDFRNTILWSAAVLVSLPLFIANFRKIKAVSMLLAEMSVTGKAGSAKRRAESLRRPFRCSLPW